MKLPSIFNSVERMLSFVLTRAWLRLFLYFVFSFLFSGLLFLLRAKFSSTKHIGANYEFERTSTGVVNLHNVMQKIALPNSQGKMVYKALREREVRTGLPTKLQFSKLGGSAHMARATKEEHQDSKIGKPGMIYPYTKTTNLSPGTLKHRPLQTESISTSSSVSTVKAQATTERSTAEKYPTLKERSNLPSQREKNHVYGEPGCPDNPWRDAGLTELFQKWINISKQYNIEYVLCGGSLLGAMRNNDIIPYDSDIDVLIDINYFTTMRRLAERRNFSRSDRKIHLVLQPEFTLNIPVEKRKRYDCQGKVAPKLTDECSFQEPLGRLFKGNLHIDFYHFYDRVLFVDDPSDDKLKQYPKKDFYPFEPCNFMGFEASCPHNPWEISRIYFNTDDFLEPIYKCKNGTWVDVNGRAA